MNKILTVFRHSNAEMLYNKALFNGPDPIIEIEIANDGYYSYYYAKDVLKTTFPLAEKEISKLPLIALDYAQNILKGRFKLLELNLSELNSSHIYMNLILKLEPEPYYIYQKYISSILKVNHE